MLHEIMKLLKLVSVLILLAACTPQRLSTVPEGLATKTNVVGFESDLIRVFGDASRSEIAQFDASRVPTLHVGQDAQTQQLEQNFLVLSGGGANGAYGAGLLNGWTKSETRPHFSIVTGVSTGAIIAPFAFLGSEYDHFLTEFYTKHSTKDLLRKRVVAGLLGGSSLASSQPLEKLIEKFVTFDLMSAIAREYAKGRFLLLGTTNLDVQRPVIWNMGAIAMRGDAEALKLFRDVIRASISVPAVFEPVLIDVIVSGYTGQELHVDGGTTDNAILLPMHVQLHEANSQAAKQAKRRMFVIVNSNINPEVGFVDIKALDVAERSLDTLLHQQTASDIERLYRYANRNDVTFHYTQIPDGFDLEPKEEFDRLYMTTLYRLGEKRALEGDPWRSQPPFIVQ